jgi:hypothetical protein
MQLSWEKPTVLHPSPPHSLPILLEMCLGMYSMENTKNTHENVPTMNVCQKNMKLHNIQKVGCCFDKQAS